MIVVILGTFSLYIWNLLQKVQDKLVMALGDRYKDPKIVIKLVVIFLLEKFHWIEIPDDTKHTLIRKKKYITC